MPSRGWERVGAVLKPLLARLSLEEKVALDRLRRDWSRLFGEPLSRHTIPADLDKGVLVVSVDSPAWLQELRYHRSDILEKLSGDEIRDVRFRLGRVFHREPRSGGTDTGPEAAGSKREPSESELRWIDETLGPVGDEEVREALKRALRKSLHARTGR